MLRREDRALFIALLIIAAALILNWVIPSPNGEIENAYEKCSSDQCHEAVATEAVAEYTKGLDVLTAALVLAAVLQGYFLIQADRTARISAEAARDAADANISAVKTAREIGRAQVRAYLTCEGATFAVERDWMVCRPLIKNFGQSPASNVEVTASVSSVKVTFAPLVPPKSTVRHSTEFTTGCSAIPAGDSTRALLVWTYADMGPQHDDIASASATFWLIGSVTWLDVFGDAHSAMFNLSLSRTDKDIGLSGAEVLRHGELSGFNHDMITERGDMSA